MHHGITHDITVTLTPTLTLGLGAMGLGEMGRHQRVSKYVNRQTQLADGVQFTERSRLS